MIDKPYLKDAAIIQQAYQIGPFSDMLRLTYQRHAAYAWAHGMEYWPMSATFLPDMWPGGWGKIQLLRMALEHGYRQVFYIDTDAAIVDMDCDLRDGLPPDKLIGACEHWAEWFNELEIPRHYNIGVTFWRNDPLVLRFLDDWLAAYPGHPRWLEQGAFNELIKDDKYAGAFHKLDDKWNATAKVNEVEKPCIMGWHGVMPEAKRFGMMKQVFADDHLRFRV